MISPNFTQKGVKVLNIEKPLRNRVLTCRLCVYQWKHTFWLQTQTIDKSFNKNGIKSGIVVKDLYVIIKNIFFSSRSTSIHVSTNFIEKHIIRSLYHLRCIQTEWKWTQATSSIVIFPAIFLRIIIIWWFLCLWFALCC